MSPILAGHWHQLFSYGGLSAKGESLVKSCLSSPVLHFKDCKMSSQGRAGFASHPQGFQTGELTLLLRGGW